MSIQDEIKAAKANQLLRAAEPTIPGSPKLRVFLMCKPLVEAIERGRSGDDYRRWANLEAQISHFVEGGYVNWNLMKWLDPQEAEHWELRNRRPRPSLRVFGRFAKPDVFVGTHVALRKKLGGKWSNQWIGEVLEIEEIWSDLFRSKPYFGSKYEDYITSNARKDVKVPK